jgi:mannan endo-1,4-beta-mannosidase
MKGSRTRRLAALGLTVLVSGTLASGIVSASAAMAATDTIAPTKPATPTANPVGFTSATINTGGSTDNDRVAGYYVQRQVNGVWTDWSATLIEPTYAYVQPLTPGTTYTVAVVAFDPSGNRSPRSDTVTFTTPVAQAPTCRVTRQNLGPQALFLTFFVDNMTTATLTNWTAAFTLPAAHTVTYTFNAILSRSGDAASFRPAPNTAQVNPGTTAYFGLSANRPAGSPLPSGFTFTSPATAPLTCSTT